MGAEWTIWFEIRGSEGLEARGYLIPGGTSQRGGGQTQAFRVARCRTRSLVDIKLGPIGSRQRSLGTCMGPYLSRTLIRVHRFFRQGWTGPVGPYRLNSGFRRVSVGTLILHDRLRRGLTGRLTVPYPCRTKIRTPRDMDPPRHYGSPRGRRGLYWHPMGPQRPAKGTVGSRFIGAHRFRALMRPSLLSA